MEDDILTPASSDQTSAPKSDDPELDTGSGRVFDITDDLNISPAEDVVQRVSPATSPTPSISPAPKPAAPVVPPQQPTSSITTPSAWPTAPTQPPISTLNIPGAWPAEPTPPQAAPVPPRTPPKIPLQDISIPPTQQTPIRPPLNTPPRVPKSPIGAMSAQAQIPEQNQEAAKTNTAHDPNLKPIRTYESDVAEVLSHKKPSTASIAIAEARKNEGAEIIKNDTQDAQEKGESNHIGLKIFITFLSLILLGGGAFGAYYFYIQSPLASVNTPTPAQQQAASLIPVDNQMTVDITGLSPTAIISRVRVAALKPQAPETITEIIPVETISNSINRVAAPDMVSLLDIPAPDILTRSLTPAWLLGVYADSNGDKTGFVIVTTNFFQNTFAGMLQWENVMADDLKQYLYSTGSPAGIANVGQNTPNTQGTLTNSSIVSPLTSTTTATSTIATSTSKKIGSTSNSSATSTAVSTTEATTTDSIQPLYTLRGHFEDGIVKNKDVRIFRTSDGKILFLYSFIDNSRLVIAGNEAALSEIITRLDNQAYVR